MKLSLRFLNDVASVNSFEPADSFEFFAGDNQTLYFQLVDISLDRPEHGFNPAGRRYMPPATSTLQVTLSNIDDAKKIVRMATQPFPLDPSIWAITILPSDPVKGTVGLKLVLTEPGPRVFNSSHIPGVFIRVE